MADDPKASTVAGDYLRERIGTVWSPDQIIDLVADALDAEADAPSRSHGAQKKT